MIIHLYKPLGCTALTVNPNGNWGLGVTVMYHHRFIDYNKCTPLERGVDNGAGGSAGKESTCKVGDLGLIPGLGRSPGEGNRYPLQYSGLENSMDCIVHGVTKTWI